MTLEILEIERLRKHLEEAEAEIERLMALVAQQSRKHDADMLAMQLAHNREIEWLTPKAENWQRIATEITASEHALRLDNEQLRAALQALADDTSVPPWIRTLARHALESRP